MVCKGYHYFKTGFDEDTFYIVISTNEDKIKDELKALTTFFIKKNLTFGPIESIGMCGSYRACSPECGMEIIIDSHHTKTHKVAEISVKTDGEHKKKFTFLEKNLLENLVCEFYHIDRI
ncbi:MAG: hypothetical protein KKE93_01570 [Nanoarchaeota archaeon]|nr:hypothetical protein [Nanoarchaeota archaeon]